MKENPPRYLWEFVTAWLLEDMDRACALTPDPKQQQAIRDMLTVYREGSEPNPYRGEDRACELVTDVYHITKHHGRNPILEALDTHARIVRRRSKGVVT